MPSSPRPEREVVRLAATNPEPVAAMRVWAAAVTLGDHTYAVPALGASHWLEVLLAEDLDLEAIFPGFCGPETILDVNQRILTGEITVDDLQQGILDLLEEVGGRRWWIVLRLCRSLRAHWDSVGGELARHGVTPFNVPLSYWLDAAYTTMLELIITRSEKPKKAEEWNRALVTPPASEARKIDEDENSLAFLAAMRGSR